MNRKPKVAAIIEVRMSSSRLPGKHMLLVNGKPILGHLINRLKAVPRIDDIIIATTTNAGDDVLEDFSLKEGALVYRGSEDDVMGRVLQAARNFHADVICEVTGDCPIIDPDLVEQLIQTYFCNDAKYVNNGQFGLPDGMGAQVFSAETLAESEAMTNAPLDREHVTLHIRNNPKLFPPIYLAPPPSLKWPGLGLTLDEKKDYDLLKLIIEHFGNENPLFTCLDVVRLLRLNPEWVAINQDVKRKGDA